MRDAGPDMLYTKNGERQTCSSKCISFLGEDEAKDEERVLPTLRSDELTQFR